MLHAADCYKAICEGGQKHQVPIRLVHSNEVLGGQVYVLLSLDKEAVERKM